MATPAAKALSTRLLVLLEVHNRKHSKLRTIAERLDVTVQAVSDYLKRLNNEGLVENASGTWRPTKRGTAWLHETVRGLREFLEQSEGALEIIDQTLAFADRRIRAEESVALFMRDGYLWAGSLRKATSKGRAVTEAEKGQLCLVSKLEGIIDLEPATVTLLSHPDFPTGGPLARAQQWARKLANSKTRSVLAVYDSTSLAWANALGRRADIEFAAVEAVQEASRRGVPVILLVPEHARAAVETQLRRTEAGKEPVPLEVRRA